MRARWLPCFLHRHGPRVRVLDLLRTICDRHARCKLPSSFYFLEKMSGSLVGTVVSSHSRPAKETKEDLLAASQTEA